MQVTKESVTISSNSSTRTSSSHSSEEELDLQTLTRKISKVDRMLQKPKQEKSIVEKLQRKRGQYLQKMGELAYKEARASMTQHGLQGETRDNDDDDHKEEEDILASPTAVTSIKFASPNLQEFQDSLTIFEDSDRPTG